MDIKWNIVSEVGNPDKEGEYDVILIHDDMRYDGPEGEHYLSEEKWTPAGRAFAERDSRWFGEAEPNDGWIMKNQPREGLVWHETVGSSMNEWVYAWLPLREYPEIELPKGVEWEQ